MAKFKDFSFHLILLIFFFVSLFSSSTGKRVFSYTSSSSLLSMKNVNPNQNLNENEREMYLKQQKDMEILKNVVAKIQSNEIEVRNEMSQLKGRMDRLEKNPDHHILRREVPKTPGLSVCINHCAYDFKGSTKPMNIDGFTGNMSNIPVMKNPPSNCKDLKEGGYVLSGYYPVKQGGKIDLIFCNFTSPLFNDSEARVGFIDVKHSAIHFYVQKSQPFQVPNVPIPFEIEVLNVGKAMNLKSGVFTTPRPGIYVFAFNGIKGRIAGATGVYLLLNGKESIAHGYGTPSLSSGSFTIALHCTVELRKGDRVNLVIESGALYDDELNYSSFTGSLVEERID